MSDPRGVYVVSSNSGMDRSRRKPVVNVVDGTRNWSTVPCACCADCSSCKFQSFYINTVNESTEHLLSFYDPIATAQTYHVGPSLKIIRKTNTNISPPKITNSQRSHVDTKQLEKRSHWSKQLSRVSIN